ncbi:MAG: helix-turn-helix domain-containing protein, partial [Rhodoplanes sp.]
MSFASGELTKNSPTKRVWFRAIGGGIVIQVRSGGQDHDLKLTTTRAGRTTAGAVFSSLQPARYMQAMHEQPNGIEASASLLAKFDLTISSDRQYSQIEIEFERDVMAKIDLARRAQIGREKRARTRVQIVDAGLILLAERPPEGLTVDAIVESAGVAKGTFYYHFQSVEELVAAAGARLADTFDELLARSRLDQPDPIERMSFAFTKFLEKAISDPVWARLVVRSAQAPAGIRENLKADLAEAIA